MAVVENHGIRPEVTFAVDPEDDVYQVHTLAHRVQRVAWEVFSWVCLPVRLHLWLVRTAILPASTVDQNGTIGIHMDAFRCPLPFGLQANPNEKRNAIFEKEGDHARHICLQAADGNKVDGMVFWNQEQRGLPLNEQKWVICFNGNGAPYEFAGSEYRMLADDNGANVLTINLRGTILSEGIATTKEDLYLDGEAALLYLTKGLGVPANKIVIKGHSLGGGIASAVAAKHPGVGLFIDRSFSQITDVVKEMGFPLSLYGSFWVNLLGFNLTSVDNFRNFEGPKAVLYSDFDHVIPPKCNLGPAVAEDLDRGRIENIQAGHMNTVWGDESVRVITNDIVGGLFEQLGG